MPGTGVLYPKPRGRPKLGCEWDALAAEWVALTPEQLAERREEQEARRAAAERPKREASLGVAAAVARHNGDVAVADALDTRGHAGTYRSARGKPPKPRGRGRKPKPRGRAPRDCEWDYDAGVWVKDVDRVEADFGEMEDLENAAGEENPCSNPSAVKPKPRGRVPRGCAWDHVAGEWVRLDDDKEDEPVPVSPSTHHKTARKGFPRPPGRAPRGCAWDHATGSWVLVEEEKNEAPATPPVGQLSGRKPRPPGRAPRGCTWDHIAGSWVRLDEDDNEDELQALVEATADPSPQLPRKLKQHGPFRPALARGQATAHDEPSKKRPPGRAPKGCVWDAIAGAWCKRKRFGGPVVAWHGVDDVVWAEEEAEEAEPSAKRRKAQGGSAAPAARGARAPQRSQVVQWAGAQQQLQPQQKQQRQQQQQGASPALAARSAHAPQHGQIVQWTGSPQQQPTETMAKGSTALYPESEIMQWSKRMLSPPFADPSSNIAATSELAEQWEARYPAGTAPVSARLAFRMHSVAIELKRRVLASDGSMLPPSYAEAVTDPARNNAGCLQEAMAGQFAAIAHRATLGNTLPARFSLAREPTCTAECVALRAIFCEVVHCPDQDKDDEPEGGEEAEERSRSVEAFDALPNVDVATEAENLAVRMGLDDEAVGALWAGAAAAAATAAAAAAAAGLQMLPERWWRSTGKAASKLASSERRYIAYQLILQARV